MQKVIDKVLLLTAGMLACGAFFGFRTAAVPCLAAAILACLSTLAEREWLSALLFIGYAVCCCFFPFLLPYLPLLSYDLSRPPYAAAEFALLPPLFLAARWETAVAVLMLQAFAMALGYRTRQFLSARRSYYSFQDIAKENNLLLERKNRELTEQQFLRLQTAKLEERNRIAREIHDSVGHVLTSCILQTGALIATAKDDAVRAGLTQLKDSLTTGMNSIRLSVHDLHEEVFDLEGEIDKLVKAFSFCPVAFRYDADSIPKKEYCLATLAFVKECLNNIAKHSGATRAKLTFTEHPSFYRFEAADNGCGLTGRTEGLGLAGMRERVDKLSGTFSVSDGPGCKIVITLPRERKL